MKHRTNIVKVLSEACRALLSAFITLALLPSTGRADIVTDWNEKALATMASERVGGGVGPVRTLSMMHIAMFDAVNSCQERYTPYWAAMPEAAGASPEAAAHAAARRVLAGLYPKQQASLDVAFDAAIAKLPASAARSAGIAAGEKAALAMLAARKADGFESPETYRPVTSPGVYIATTLPVNSNVAGAKPFALPSVSHFRPGPPPSLDSALWARDYNEIKELGAVDSTKRTAWQTETGRFGAQVGNTLWNQVARALIAGKPLPLVESARLFAFLNIAIADAYLASFDAKYHYGFWRPITAIRNGDRDGNDATERDAGWMPLIDAPMHPDYPCAHCVVHHSAGAVLKSVFGAGTLSEFTWTYAAMPGVTRKYTSIQQVEDEITMARVWGGVNFRTSNEVGNDVGRQVGEYVLQHYLRPLR